MISLIISCVCTILALALSWFFSPWTYRGYPKSAPLKNTAPIPDKRDLSEKITYWRISGIPEDCDNNKLMDCLRDFDKSFKIEPSDLSLYPGCYDRKQVAVIRTKGSPDSFRRIKSEASYFMIPGLSTDGVMVDRNFYHLTPLNRPEDGDDMIEWAILFHSYGLETNKMLFFQCYCCCWSRRARNRVLEEHEER